MNQENSKRLLRNAAVVGGIVLIVIVIFLIIRGLFFMPRAEQTAAINPLVNTSIDRGVSMNVRGPIVASENTRMYSVDVTSTSRSVTLYSGYDGAVISKQVYPNSMSSYEQFVYALDKAGMTNERTTNLTDTRGVCATGRLYTFALERDTTIESSLWTSTCSNQKGSLNGGSASLRSLFDSQIPDISKFRGGII